MVLARLQLLLRLLSLIQGDVRPPSARPLFLLLLLLLFQLLLLLLMLQLLQPHLTNSCRGNLLIIVPCDTGISSSKIPLIRDITACSCIPLAAAATVAAGTGKWTVLGAPFLLSLLPIVLLLLLFLLLLLLFYVLLLQPDLPHYGWN
jgi:hypothetical protein